MPTALIPKAGQKPHFVSNQGKTKNMGNVGTTYQWQLNAASYNQKQLRSTASRKSAMSFKYTSPILAI
ncbi:hypothetical protein PTD2_00681 [Pseudoalteromonas tunicata D2]|uniref:Uncharacterized protein n=1 Tax=Pseudoalteromonas tunicata D2 TaxID=87626 RepID=A4C3A7_9GAMM|nr:hypothetical protein PTD2_00681 [Pseudoalteromonas tunicata D2]